MCVLCSELRSTLNRTLLASADAGARLDAAMKQELNPLASEIMKKSLPAGQHKAFPGNNFSMMTLSGAKGSIVNHSQISCLLGQQVFLSVCLSVLFLYSSLFLCVCVFVCL